MQAITTKYLGPTNHRGSRVKAQCQRGSVTVSWDNALGLEENHDLAFQTLCHKFGWAGHGAWHRGYLPGTGNVYVCATDLGGGSKVTL